MTNILITAGGTSERIDSVRRITNNSTGRLGSIIADVFTRGNTRVTFLCSETSVIPAEPNVKIIRVQDTTELSAVVEDLLTTTHFDCIIHSMAVSDFTPHSILTRDDFIKIVISESDKPDLPADTLAERLAAAVFDCEPITQGLKISSANKNLAVILKQTPKIIECFKRLKPETLLIGFKLLANVTEDTLIAAGRRQIEQYGCDLVLANDLSNIIGNTHKAFLMDNKKILSRGESKTEIAEMLFSAVSERINIA